MSISFLIMTLCHLPLQFYLFHHQSTSTLFILPFSYTRHLHLCPQYIRKTSIEHLPDAPYRLLFMVFSFLLWSQ